MADLATLQTRLSEAEEALHALALGTRTVEVERDGRRVKYQAADKGTLADYIADLQRQIDEAEIAASSTTRPRRRFIAVAFR